MLDLNTPRGAIVAAALRLAERQGWRETSLQEIAIEAGITLAQLRGEFQSKAQMLAAFSRLVDDAVLAAYKPGDAGVAPRDRLFDVLMTRYDMMMPYKAGLKRIADDLKYAPLEAGAQLMPAMKSQYWMLSAAGINAEGFRGSLRVKALTGLYARVLGIWLEDGDPGMARTMAALDRRLRRGEDIAKRLDSACSAGERFLRGMRESFDNARTRATDVSPQESSQPAKNDAPAAGTADPGAAGAAPSGA